MVKLDEPHRVKAISSIYSYFKNRVKLTLMTLIRLWDKSTSNKVGILPNVNDSIFSRWLWLEYQSSHILRTTNKHSYFCFFKDIKPEVEVSYAEQRCKNRSSNICDVVVTKVNARQFVKFREWFFWNILYLRFN